jgi:hypothetical protein
MRLKGIEAVNAKLKKAKKGLVKDAFQGLLLTAAMIRRDMDLKPPKIPVDTGNLRASWYVTSGFTTKTAPAFKGKKQSQMNSAHAGIVGGAAARAKAFRFPLVIMGFSANYGIKVHEEMKTGKRPGSGGKFFKSAIDRARTKVPMVLAKTMKF